MRTLQKLLTRIDQRGYERSAQQLEFHVAFMKAAARVIYRGSWETERPAIMKKYGWEKSNSEVLISTPRRFGVRAHRTTRIRRLACASRAWRCLLDRKLSALPSSARASRCLSGSRLLYSARLDVPPENYWKGSWNLSDWPAARPRCASITRRLVGLTPSTVTRASSDRSLPKSACVPLRLEPA